MFSRWQSLWRNLVHRERADRDLDDEVRAIHELLVDEKIRGGMPSGAARRAATLELGHVESIKNGVRDARAGASIDAILHDVRYGARMLKRSPLATLTASLSLAICLGANTTIFTIANRLLFADPAGVRDPGRLVDIAPTDGRKLIFPAVPLPTYSEIRERATLLESVYGYALEPQPLSMRADGAAAERIFSTFVTTNYFAALGVGTAAGRLFGNSDGEAPGANPVAVLSHSFWQRRFNGDHATVGRTVLLNGTPMTIVGVAAERFRGISLVMADVWVPASMAETLKRPVALMVGGRLRPGGSAGEAAAQIAAIGSTLRVRPPAPPAPGGPGVRGFGLQLSALSPIPPLLRIPATAVLSFLTGVVILVLVIACANVAGVLLARATARRREIAVRLAIGAGRGRLIRQLLTETLLLFVLGGAAGLVLARVLTSLLLLVVPALPVPLDLSMPLDARVVAFTLVVSLIAALASGIVPARQASRADVVSALKADAQGPSDRLRLRNAFVVAQIALGIVLVVAAGLLIRATERATWIDSGFDANAVEASALDLSIAGYTGSSGPRLIADVVDRVRALPGVEQATAAALVPGGFQMRVCCGITVPGVSPPQGERYLQPAWNFVAPGYFATLRIPVGAGRDFDGRDVSGSDAVAIVSEAAARQYWPGQDPIGKYLLWHAGSNLISTNEAERRPPPVVRLSVVGVAGDIGTGAGAAQPLIYVPLQQRYQSSVFVLARATEERRLAAEIRGVVASLDPNLPIVSSMALDEETNPVVLQLRISAAVCVAIGAVGLLLAAIGIYGVTAYTVARRTREIGIRLAMGARRVDVLLMVLRQGMGLVIAGSAIGLLLAAASSRVLVRLLFGVPPLDPVAFGGAALLLSMVGLIACCVPAVRAARIGAIEALRYE